MSAEQSLNRPELYKLGQRQELSGTLVLLASLMYAVYTSLALFFIPCGVFHDSAFDYQIMAVTVSLAAILCVNIEVRVQPSVDSS